MEGNTCKKLDNTNLHFIASQLGYAATQWAFPDQSFEEVYPEQAIRAKLKGLHLQQEDIGKVVSLAGCYFRSAHV
jgi:hypothetical protein